MNKICLGAVVGLTMLSQVGYAKDIFEATISVAGQGTQYNSYNSVSDVGDQYDFDNLKQIFPNYTGTEAVTASVNLRGANGKLTYGANSNSLNLSILGINRVYNGATREEAQDRFSDEIKNDKELLAALSKYWVENTATDPVAGNPSSALSRSATAAAGIISDMVPDVTSGKEASTSVGIAPRFGRYTADSYNTKLYSLPFYYAHWFEGQKVGLAIDVPLTVTDTEGALSGNIDFGIGVNFKVASTSDYTWYVMPMLRTGVTGSEDSAAAAWTYGASLASNAQFPISDQANISIINMVSRYKTDNLKVGDYDGQYDLDNTILRNGIEYSHIMPGLIMNKPLVAKIQYARTDYHGDKLFTELSHEVSGSLGIKNSNPQAWINEYRLGFTANYDKTAKNDSKGFSVNLGYKF